MFSFRCVNSGLTFNVSVFKDIKGEVQLSQLEKKWTLLKEKVDFVFSSGGIESFWLLEDEYIMLD